MLMDKEFLRLLEDARLGVVSKPVALDYEKLYLLAKKHQVSALIFNQIYNFPDLLDDLKKAWRKETIRTNAIQAMKTDKFLRIYQKFLDNNLKVIIVKGLICRSLYPQPDNRPSNDEDLYVEKEYFAQVKAILLAEGLVIIDESDDVTTFVEQNCGIMIELHTSLFSEESKAYGQYQSLFKQAFDDPIVHQIQGIDVYSLSYDLHFLFLLIHFVKHFLHGGVGIRQVIDIIMYAEAYGDKINWQRIYQILEQLNVCVLILNVFALAKTNLAFNLEQIELPADCNLDNLDYQPLLDDILDAGIFGKSSKERLHSSTITLNAMEKGKTSVMGSIFPTYQEMRGKFKYLNKYPLLLPVAYFTRIYHYLKDNDKTNSQKTIEIGSQRVDLLKKYKVID